MSDALESLSGLAILVSLVMLAVRAIAKKGWSFKTSGIVFSVALGVGIVGQAVSPQSPAPSAEPKTAAEESKHQAQRAAEPAESARPKATSRQPASKKTHSAQKTKKPVEEEQSWADMKATVQYFGDELVVQNQNNYAWKEVKIEINKPGIFQHGYALKVASIPAKTRLIRPFADFAKPDGTRLNGEAVKLLNIRIECEAPFGSAEWRGESGD